MTRSKLISVLAMFLLSAVLSADAWLIKDSRSDGKIFLPPEYGKALQLASLELQNFLEQMSGARLPFAWGARGRSESGIVLEVRQEAEWKGKESPQAFTIETQERPYPLVTIRGNTSLAVLYGVYQYLENLGIRFLAPGESGTNIPGTDGIRVVKGKKKYTPSFEMRTFPCRQRRTIILRETTLPPSETTSSGCSETGRISHALRQKDSISESPPILRGITSNP